MDLVVDAAPGTGTRPRRDARAGSPSQPASCGARLTRPVAGSTTPGVPTPTRLELLGSGRRRRRAPRRAVPHLARAAPGAGSVASARCCGARMATSAPSRSATARASCSRRCRSRHVAQLGAEAQQPRPRPRPARPGVAVRDRLLDVARPQEQRRRPRSPSASRGRCPWRSRCARRAVGADAPQHERGVQPPQERGGTGNDRRRHACLPALTGLRGNVMKPSFQLASPTLRGAFATVRAREIRPRRRRHVGEEGGRELGRGDPRLGDEPAGAPVQRRVPALRAGHPGHRSPAHGAARRVPCRRRAGRRSTDMPCWPSPSSPARPAS